MKEKIERNKKLYQFYLKHGKEKGWVLKAMTRFKINYSRVYVIIDREINKNT